ncbi:hypothetical protein DFP72DRAFT_919274 [Ephemerocybe angulata]|uniref:Secreted protein n=1 Tax=Ephemerocybe angulata TaxID=980116 RepID=A0A8H6HIJ3_9AGAR|nr:hypothetical protein DFP72DRAFT_919274 [Tulosesus angulatus]
MVLVFVSLSVSFSFVVPFYIPSPEYQVEGSPVSHVLAIERVIDGHRCGASRRRFCLIGMLWTCGRGSVILVEGDVVWLFVCCIRLFVHSFVWSFA